jgi:hypothetical protein
VRVRAIAQEAFDSILAAFDLGAPAEVLEAIYNRDSKVLRPIHLDDRSDVEINCNNWKEHLGVEK